MAAYHKVEVSLNTNAVEVGIPSPQTVNVVVPTIGPAGPVGSVGPVGPQGPQGVPGTGLEVLTTQGDLLYQGASTGQRLPIGTSGQILRVANGIPSWGNESGAVTSVNGETGAVSLSAADVGAAAASHTHDGTQVEIVADDATGPVLAAGFSEGSGVNGIYWPTDTTANALLVYKLNRTYGMFFEAGRWHIYELAPLSANIVVSSDLDDTDYPHQSNWPTGSVTKASLSNFGDNAAQQFRFVGDSMAVTDVTNAVSTSDSRLSDSRTPTLHGSSHHTGGTDALAAHQINGQTIFSVASVNYSDDETLPANRARQITISNSNASGITVTLPTQAEGTLNGDTYVIVGGSTMSGPITVRSVANLSPLVYNTHVTITATGQRYRLRSGGGSGGSWTLIPVDTHTHTGSQVTVGTTANLPLRTGTNGVIEAGSFSNTAGSFCEGNDARLSDARTPSSTLAHAASHAAGVKASSIVQVAEMSTPVLVRANAAGTAGNSITLTFNGSQSIINRLSAWNSANPSNQATLIWGDGSQIPENGEDFTLSGGVAGGSDPIPSFSQLVVNDGNDVSLVSLNGESSDIIEFESQELTFQHTGGNDTPYISVTDENNNEALLGLRQGQMFLQGSNPDVRIEQGGGVLANILMANAKLESGELFATITTDGGLSDDVTLTIPDQSGTIAVVTDIPTTAGDVGAVAAGAITTSGLTQATARILGRTSASTGAVEEIQIGSGLSLSAGELSATSSGGVTAVGASTADVLSVSGSDLVADDPNADRIVFWDDSESKLRYLEAGSGLSISGTTMTATSTFDPASPAGIGTTTPNTGAFTSLTGAPPANTAAYAVTGYSLTGSNAQSVIDLAGTWNTTGTPSAIKLNVTDTASNASSLLMQLQTGGTNRFTVSKGGVVTTTRITTGSSYISQESGYYSLYPSGTETLTVTNNSAVGCALRSSSFYSISTSPSGVAADVRWYRDDANIWASRNDTSAQEIRMYGTFTSSTNFQRMTVKSVKQTLSALSGASATTTGTFIPDGAVVVGVTTRVGTALTGATGYTVGDGTDADRWGDITGTAIGTTSDNANWTAGTIECFTAGGNVTLTANGSNFTAGAIEICVFYLAGQAD